MIVLVTKHIRRYGAKQNVIFRQLAADKKRHFVLGLLYNKVSKEGKAMLKKWIKPVYAHCDVPCGIYETDTMLHAAETCRRMVEKYGELGDVGDPEHHNQFVRIVMYKEEHAKKCKEQLYILWSDYFKPEHLNKFPDLHNKFWMATKQCGKVKQTLSLEECDKLLMQVKEIAAIFSDSKK